MGTRKALKSPNSSVSVQVTSNSYPQHEMNSLSAASTCELSAYEMRPPYPTSVLQYERIDDEDDLFYAPAMIGGKIELLALVDSGSVTCTLSEAAEQILRDSNLIDDQSCKPTKKTLTGCGGNQTKPKCEYELNVDMFDCRMTVNVLVVPGQEDDMIVGSNVIRHVTQQVKKTSWYWNNVSKPVGNSGHDPLLNMLSNVKRWHGKKIPDRVGTVVLRQSVTLEPQHEHLVWGKLKEDVPLSIGSTIVVEPSTSLSAPRNVMVARSVCPLWGDKWIPMKVINMLDRPIILRRNAKLAQVHPCLALEELEIPDQSERTLQETTAQHVIQTQGLGERHEEGLQEQYLARLHELGLDNIDLHSVKSANTGRQNCQI